MILWFEAPAEVRIKTFLGLEDPREYLFTWIEKWCNRTAQEWVHLLIHALGPLPTAWYLDVELHQCNRHWEDLRDEFLGTFVFIGGTEVLDAALQDIDTVAWGESHLCIAPKIPSWELQTWDKVKYYNLAPKEGQKDPRVGHDLELNKVCTDTGPLELRMDSSGTHHTLAKIGDAHIIYLPAPKTKE